MNENQIQNDIRIAVGQLPDVVIWRNESGVAEHKGRYVRYGLCKGSADLIGVLAPKGRFVALEVKTPRGRVSKEQNMFLNLVRSQGGFACVVRSVEEALQAISRAKNGETT
tara:strand:- start:141 stop:473 length:333 start_codon:yes stop_codon:yes gene_type:complete